MQRVLKMGKNTHAFKLIGAFIFFIGIMGILASVASMLQSWHVSDNLKDCYNEMGEPYILECKNAAYNDTEIMLYPHQAFFTSNQMIEIALYPMMELFAWIVVFIFGLMLYRTGHRVIPLKEEEDKKKSKKTTKKKKKK